MGALCKKEYSQFVFPHHRHYFIDNIVTPYTRTEQNSWKKWNDKYELFPDFWYRYIHTYYKFVPHKEIMTYDTTRSAKSLKRDGVLLVIFPNGKTGRLEVFIMWQVRCCYLCMHYHCGNVTYVYSAANITTGIDRHFLPLPCAK